MKRPSIHDHIVRIDGQLSTSEKLQKFAQLILKNSNEGENCALLAGLAFYFLSNGFDIPLKINVHPVNQSGASSKEISDVDVYLKNKLRFTAEVKDKIFTKEDVDHAAYKVQTAGHAEMFFMTGPNATTALTAQQINEIGIANGIRITLVSIASFYEMTLGLCKVSITAKEAWQMIAQICQSAKMKQTTIENVRNSAQLIELIE